MKKIMKPRYNVSETQKDIGKRIMHSFSGLVVEVKIIDAKFAYGTKRWLVKPDGQVGSTWIIAPKNYKFLEG